MKEVPVYNIQDNNETTMMFCIASGVVLISLALLCDAVIGNVQEGAMRLHGEGATHVVLYSYSLGFVLILVGLVATGQLFPGFAFAAQVQYCIYESFVSRYS